MTFVPWFAKCLRTLFRSPAMKVDLVDRLTYREDHFAGFKSFRSG